MGELNITMVEAVCQLCNKSYSYHVNGNPTEVLKNFLKESSFEILSDGSYACESCCQIIRSFMDKAYSQQEQQP